MLYEVDLRVNDHLKSTGEWTTVSKTPRRRYAGGRIYVLFVALFGLPQFGHHTLTISRIEPIRDLDLRRKGPLAR